MESLLEAVQSTNNKTISECENVSDNNPLHNSSSVEADDGVVEVDENEKKLQISPPVPSPPPPPTNSTNVYLKNDNEDDDDDNNEAGSHENESEDSSHENENNSPTRRMFTREFKQRVLNAFGNDPECSGNQRATARKFGIHRRQVQKWLQQTGETHREPEPIIEDSVQKEKSSTPQVSGKKKQNYHQSKTSASLNRCVSVGARKQIQNFRKCETEPGISDETDSDNEISKPSEKSKRKSEVDENKSREVKGKKKNFDCNKIPSPSSLASPEEAFDLSKMSSASMALSLNLSMNPNPGSAISSNHFDNFNSNSLNQGNNLMLPHYGNGNNISPYLNSNALLRLFPHTNSLLHSNFPINSNGNGISDKYKLPERYSVTSPANLSTASGGDGSHRTTPIQYSHQQNAHHPMLTNPLALIDEISYIYPHEDYTLLREALIRNEVTLTKVDKLLASPNQEPLSVAKKHPTSDRTGGRVADDMGRRDSPSPTKSSPLSNVGHQAISPLDLLKHQNDYFKLLQQSGIAVPFSGNINNELTNSGFGSSTDSSKYPSWFQSLATAAALRLAPNNLSEQSESNKSGRKKSGAPTFATPKLPSSTQLSNTVKPKTVAAALAASRQTPNKYENNHTRTDSTSTSPDKYDLSKSKATLSQRRKQSRGKLNSSGARKSYPGDDNFIDPTSMLEVVTTPPTIENSSSTAYGKDALQNFATATNPLHFLNQLLLESPTPYNKSKFPEISLPKYYENLMKSETELDSNANGVITSAENHLKESKTDSSSNDSTKDLVLQAFVSDREVSGDARAVARKYGLSVRVVMKWIKESSRHSSSTMNGAENHHLDDSHNEPDSPLSSLSAKSIPTLKVNGGGHSHINGNANEAMTKLMNDMEAASALNNLYYSSKNSESLLKKPINVTIETETETHLATSANNLRRLNNSSNITSSSTNKRKNSKPNQICDFAQDDSFLMDEPVDMIVPNKKRRFSSAQQDM